MPHGDAVLPHHAPPRGGRLSRCGPGIRLAVLLLAGWVAWFLLARVARYEVTDSARLEVDRAVHRVDAPVAGRVVATRLVLSRELEAGDIR
jgi:hypothetical protein